LTAPPRHGPDPATYTLRQVRQVHTELADYRDAQTDYSQAIRSVGTALTAIPLPQAVVDRINGLRNQLQEHGGRRDEQLATMQEAVDAAAAAGIDVRAGQQQVDDDRARLPTRLPTTAQLRDDPLQMTTPAAYDLEDSLQAAVNSAGDLATQTRLRANTLLESLTEALSVPMRGFHTAIRDDQASEPARRDREARLRAWLEQAETAGHEVGQLRNNLDTANARVTQASDALGALPETLDHLDVPALARLHPGMRELHDAIAARNQTLEDVENELAGTGVPRPAADHAASDTSHPPPPGPQPGPAPDSQAPDSQRPDSQRPATPESRAPRGTSRPGTSANYEALATAFQAADLPALDPGETVDDQVRALAALAAAVDGDRATRTALATGEPETVARTDRATRLLPPAPEGGYGHTAWLSSEQLDHYVPGMPVNLPHLMVTQPGRPTRREGHNVRFVVQTAQGRAAGPLLGGDHAEVVLPRGAAYDVVQVTEPDYTGMREIHLRDTVPAAPGGDAVDTLPAGIPVAEEPRSPQITAATAQQSSDQPTGSLSGWEIGAPASAGQHLGRSADLRRGQ
jgi:hypothetical protein